MFKMVTILLVLVMAFMVMAPSATAAEGRGGFMGFIAGCCFGIRAAGDYNEGKDIHWREWLRVVPVASTVVAIWDGIDGASGVTTAEFANQYGSQYY